MRPQCKLGRWTWVGVLAATLLPTAYGQGVLPHTPLAPVAPNVVAGYGPGLPAFPRAASLAPVGPVGLLPSASAGLLPSAAVAGALSPAAATALAPSQSFGLTAAYSLTTQTMQNSSAGQALGAEMGRPRSRTSAAWTSSRSRNSTTPGGSSRAKCWNRRFSSASASFR